MNKDKEYMVQVKQELYEDLLERDAWLSALEAAGIDNWEGLDHALSIYNERNKVAQEPVHLRLIRNMEEGVVEHDNSPSSVNN